MWKLFSGKGLAILESWPKSKKISENNLLKIPIQINGKIRDLLEVEKDINKDDILLIAKNQKKVEKILLNKEINKVVYVPNKILSIVVK